MGYGPSTTAILIRGGGGISKGHNLDKLATRGKSCSYREVMFMMAETVIEARHTLASTRKHSTQVIWTGPMSQSEFSILADVYVVQKKKNRWNNSAMRTRCPRNTTRAGRAQFPEPKVCTSMGHAVNRTNHLPLRLGTAKSKEARSKVNGTRDLRIKGNRKNVLNGRPRLFLEELRLHQKKTRISFSHRS